MINGFICPETQGVSRLMKWLLKHAFFLRK